MTRGGQETGDRPTRQKQEAGRSGDNIAALVYPGISPTFSNCPLNYRGMMSDQRQ